MRTPLPPLPEMTLRAAGVAPPMRLLLLVDEKEVILTPSPLAAFAVPVASVPMKLPSTTQSPEISMLMPVPKPKRLTTRPRTVCVPPINTRPLALTPPEVLICAPESSTSSTALLPTASVLGEAPGCV
jgi:hypothetical protein